MERKGELAALERLALEDSRRTIERALDAAREVLEMDIAYYSEFAEGEQVIRSVRGDSDSFRFGEGTRVPLEETYCRRMLTGVVPSVIPDARSDERVRDLPATRKGRIGSYVGVPLRLSNGRIYGTLCCASHAARHSLDERDARFMRVLARLVAYQLELEGVDPPSTNEGEEGPTRPPDGSSNGALVKLSLWFAGAAGAAPAARNALASLDEHLDEGRRHDLRLVVTELITNSVRHAGIGPANSVGLDLSLSAERLRVEVSDPGPGFQPEIAPDLDRGGGWGLFLVDRLTDRWGVVYDGFTRVWFEIALAPAEEAAARS